MSANIPFSVFSQTIDRLMQTIVGPAFVLGPDATLDDRLTLMAAFEVAIELMHTQLIPDKPTLDRYWMMKTAAMMTVRDLKVR
jgi:hypothetical protein